MSDKELIARGAEMVTGDLILNRKVMGMYRNGQFILTPEGADELQNVVQADVKPAAAKPRAGKRAPATQVTDVEVKVEPDVDPVGSLDDILKD